MGVTGRRRKVLLVESDPQVVEIVVDSLSTRFQAHVTCVASGKDCLDVEMLEPHDAVVAELDLPDMDGLDLAEQLLALSPRPVIMIGEETGVDEVVRAMRLGVRDFLAKPFPVSTLMDAVEAAVRSRQLHVECQARHRRLREAFRQALRERRNLKARVEVICRDLVSAHRRVVDRVLDYEAISASKT